MKPFTPYKLENERETNSIVITIRVNKEEQTLIKQIKELLNINSDSKALKLSAKIGLNVIQNTFGNKIIKYLCKEKRERLTDYNKVLQEN